MFDWLLFILSLSAVSLIQVFRKHPELLKALRLRRKSIQIQEVQNNKIKKTKADKKLPLY